MQNVYNLDRTNSRKKDIWLTKVKKTNRNIYKEKIFKENKQRRRYGLK